MWKIDESKRLGFSNALVTDGSALKTAKHYLLNERKICNEYDVFLAVIEVYYSGISFQTAKQKYEDIPGVMKVLGWLANKIYYYFNGAPNTDNNPCNFDRFHNQLCKVYINKMNICRLLAEYPDITYGNAQKMINMVFKYLACYLDYNKFADLFSYCHIPIDTTILEVFETLFSVFGVHKKKYCSISWTSFDEKTYLSLVKAYRDSLYGKIGHHPWLAVDFWYWNQPSPYTAPLPKKGKTIATIAKYHA